MVRYPAELSNEMIEPHHFVLISYTLKYTNFERNTYRTGSVPIKENLFQIMEKVMSDFRF